MSGAISESVPLIFTATGSTSGSFAQAEFQVIPMGVLATACTPVGACGGGVPSSFSGPLHGEATPGTVYQVTVSIRGGASGTGSWAASVDPQVQIDPSFADASDFTLQFSPSAQSAVPEPSSMSCLGVCLLVGIAGVLARRQKRCGCLSPDV